MSFQETFSALRIKDYQNCRVEVETGREQERPRDRENINEVNLYYPIHHN